MKKTRHSTLSACVALWAVAMLAATPILLFAAEEDMLDAPDKGWRRGPVKYLMTKQEDKEFRKLKTEDDRRAFIAEFWSRRDPTPGTEENEFKARYAERLMLVQKEFAPPEGRGWEEDRGQVVLLLGAPDRVQMTAAPAGGTGPATPSAAPGGPGGPENPAAGGLAPRPRATFVYEKEIFPGGPTPAEIEFVGEGAGGFRLLTKLDLSDPRLTGLEPLPALAAAAAPPPGAAEEPEAAPQDAAPPPAPPTPAEELMTEVLAETPPESSMSLATRLDFYKTQEEDTFATLTVAVEDPGDAPVLAARLIDENDQTTASLEQDDSFTPAEGFAAGAAGTEKLFQAAHNVPPGKYSVVTAVKDPASGRVGVRREEVEVPNFNQGSLQMSSVTLARKVEPMTGAGTPDQRFMLGNFRVYPAPTPVFRAGQDLILYYQVYNTADDPSSGKPSLKVTYKFAKVEAGKKRPIRPIEQKADAAIQVYGITIADVWPAGDYEVEILVEDLVAGATVSSVVPFKVEKEG